MAGVVGFLCIVELGHEEALQKILQCLREEMKPAEAFVRPGRVRVRARSPLWKPWCRANFNLCGLRRNVKQERALLVLVDPSGWCNARAPGGSMRVCVF